MITEVKVLETEKAVVTKIIKPEIKFNEESAKFEEELRNQKMQADYRILDINGKKSYVCENATKTYKWITAKEEKALKEQGKIFVTDF